MGKQVFGNMTSIDLSLDTKGLNAFFSFTEGISPLQMELLAYELRKAAKAWGQVCDVHVSFTKALNVVDADL